MLKLIPEATESMNLIDSDYKELLMPASETGDYPIEKKALHIRPWGSHAYGPSNLDGSFTMTMYLSKDRERGFDLLKTKEDVQAFEK